MKFLLFLLAIAVLLVVLLVREVDTTLSNRVDEVVKASNINFTNFNGRLDALEATTRPASNPAK